MDARKNFAFGTLATGIDSIATSFAVGAGEGARFPAAPFNGVIWNKTDYASPAHAYHAGAAEIVRVTAIATDTLTITRAQEGTASVAHNTSGKTYEIWAGPTVRTFDRLDLSRKDLVILRDDFMSNSPAGNLDWRTVGISTGGAAAVSTSTANNPGAVEIRTGTTAGAGMSYGLTGSSSSQPNQILDGSTAWEVNYIFRFLISQSNARARLGFGDNMATVTLGDNGIFLRYDVNATYGDANFKGVCRSGGVDTVVDLGIAPTLTQWYHLRVRCLGDGVVRFSIDGGAEQPISSDLPTPLLQPMWTMVTDAAVDNRLAVDLFTFQRELAR